jgi:hypothetical protein
VSRPGTVLNVLRATWGVVLLAVPGRVLSAFERTEHTHAQRVVARILGARNVIQAAVVTVVGGRSIRREGAVVDGIHVVTCLGMAAVSRKWRRLALTDAAIAAGLCAAGVTTSGEAERSEDVGALQQ